MKAGAYFSYLMDGDFSGHVYEGYLRKDDPTGEKVNLITEQLLLMISLPIYAIFNGEHN